MLIEIAGGPFLGLRIKWRINGGAGEWKPIEGRVIEDQIVDAKKLASNLLDAYLKSIKPPHDASH